ncbi:hypothetical protein KP509_07G015400 [Ceratopteris richardii]|uniref:Phosphoribosylaminoimidazole-succinocarboxamide synthase, chloroplastic n=2 Tax=Ceratopteris richardii TaxID=49495 RepID=A0A8T2UG09_CERRI|nr:hypothetical protein KP509_07G015400 [Ceratopteris richardii]
MASAFFGVPLSSDRSSSFQSCLTMENLRPKFGPASHITASTILHHKCVRPEVISAISAQLSNCLAETHLHKTVPQLSPPVTGKVRDIYNVDDLMILVTTDRLSAFDRILATVPFKGQVLNQTSLWWFNKTKHIISNAVVSAPDPNVTIASKCKVFPVEFVVRGYVTGTTSTSLWTVYQKGIRNYCGNIFPDGLVKNQKLTENILTPTTKAADHDLPISGEEIVERGLMSREDFEYVREKALAIFSFGQEVAADHGLILVDTKYEFGKAPDGTILLIDEVHTPDSSRYWVQASYEERFKKGLEPENIDKEFLRLWFKENCDPYNDKELPQAPIDLVSELAKRYIILHDTITGENLQISDIKEGIHDRISRNVSDALQQLQR